MLADKFRCPIEVPLEDDACIGPALSFDIDQPVPGVSGAHGSPSAMDVATSRKVLKGVLWVGPVHHPTLTQAHTN